MPRRVPITIIGQQAKGRSAYVEHQETLNFILSPQGRGAKAPVVLESAPGLVDIGNAGTGACRLGQFVQWRHPDDGTKDTYAVFGRDVVRITQAAGAMELSPQLEDVPTRVRIARGRTHLMIVDGHFGYTYDGTTLEKITDADFPDQSGSGTAGRPTHCIYQDGFFIVNDADTDNFYISAIEDPSDWNALDFEAASVAPDNALALASHSSMVWILGDATAQAYYNSGNRDFPYSVILSATQEVGILAPESIAESDAGLFFLGTTPEGGRFVYRIRGQQGQVITGDAQEHQLSLVEDIEAAYGYIYSQAGKSFYVLQLDNGQPSLVYNIRANGWETRAMVDGSAYRLAGVGIFNGQNIGGSRLASRYYRLDLTNYTDAGQSFIRRRVSQVQSANNQLLDWWELIVDVETGVGNAMDPGADPQLKLRYSDDGGESWSAQLIEPLGKIGQRGRRAVFRNLGASRHRLFEFEVSDPVPVTLVGAFGYVEPLDD